MAIEELGESLLAQAKKRTKKRERRGKLMAGAVLGFTGANYLLKQNAAKRIDELNRSYQPLINQKTQQLKEGVKFWADHKDLLDEENYSHEQWKDAYFMRARKQIEAENKIQAKNNTVEELNRITREKIKDDLEAYETKLQAYSQFKNYKDTKEDVAKYLDPINRNLVKSKELIERNSTVGGKIMAAFGVDRFKGDIDEIPLANNQVIKVADSVDLRDKQAIVDFLNRESQSMTKIKSITDNVNYDMTLDKKQLELFRTVERIKTDSDIEKAVETYITSKDREKLASLSVELTDSQNNSSEKFSFIDMYELIPSEAKEGEITSQQRQLQFDINRTASILKSNGEANGITKPDMEYIQEAVDLIVEKKGFSLNKIEGKFLAPAKTEITYNRLSQTDFQNIAGKRPSGMSEGEPYTLSESNAELTNETPRDSTDELNEKGFNVLTTSQKVQGAKELITNPDIIKESPEEIRNIFNTYLESIPEDEIESRAEITLAMNKVLKLQQGGEITTEAKRADGSLKSKQGFLGPKVNTITGETMTEFSTDMEVDGQKIEIPTMVPTLTDKEVKYIQSMETGKGFDMSKEIEKNIVNKARVHARMRLDNNLSPFYQDGERDMFDIATSEDLEKMNEGERRRYRKEIDRAKRAQDRLLDPEWLEDSTPSQIKRQEEALNEYRGNISEIVEKAGTSFFISLLTPESQRLQQRIDTVEAKLTNQNLSNNSRRRLEAQLKDLQEKMANL